MLVQWRGQFESYIKAHIDRLLDESMKRAEKEVGKVRRKLQPREGFEVRHENQGTSPEQTHEEDNEGDEEEEKEDSEHFEQQSRTQ